MGASLTKHYLSGGFSIAVTYLKGRSVREMLTRADKSPITEKEIRRLLEANAGGYSWNAQQLDQQQNVPPGLLVWRTDDQPSRVAFYDSRARALFVTTQDFVNLTNATNRRTAARMKRGELLGRRTPGEIGEKQRYKRQRGGHAPEPPARAISQSGA